MTLKKIDAVVCKVGAHIKKHRAKYAVAVTSVAFIKLLNSNANDYNAFLTDNGINPNEYWYREVLEEMKNS